MPDAVLGSKTASDVGVKDPSSSIGRVDKLPMLASKFGSGKDYLGTAVQVIPPGAMSDAPHLDGLFAHNSASVWR